MVGDVGRGEALHGAGSAVVADRYGLGDELLELAVLRPGLFFSRALEEGALAGDVGDDDEVARFAGGRGVDAGAVLELREGRLAVGGHDGRPPFGTQRDALV
jgi:hypothetical protein